MKSANFEAPQPPVLLVSDLKWFYAEILVIPLSWPASLDGGSVLSTGCRDVASS